MRIPGIPELPEPTFRTSSGAWVSLDSLVASTCDALEHTISPMVCKCIVQLARWQVRTQERVDVGALASSVTLSLRAEKVVVTPPVVQGVLMAYAQAYRDLDVIAIDER